MKFLRMFGVVLVVLVALLCVGLVHQANALSAKENTLLSSNFVAGISQKLKKPALDFLSLSVFDNSNDAAQALKSLETALASFRKEFGSQLNVVDKTMPVSAQSAQAPVLVDQDLSEDDDNKFDTPAAALGSLNPSLGLGVSAPEPIQPPAAILSSGPAGLPGSPLPSPTAGAGAVPSGLPIIPSLGDLPQLGDQGQEDEGVDFGGDAFGEFDLGGDFGLPSLGQQGVVQPLGGSQVPAPLPAPAPLPGISPAPAALPAIKPLPTPAPLPGISPIPSPAPKPLAVSVVAPSLMPLSPIAEAEVLFDIPVTRKSKKIKSLDRKMDKMMALGSIFQKAATKQALALASHQEQSKNFDLMSLDINALPKVVTNNTFVGLEQASIALAGLGDLE